MGDGFDEPLVRRSRTKGREAVLAVRLQSESLAAVDAYAERKGWTRADAARVLLRAGLKAEGEIK